MGRNLTVARMKGGPYERRDNDLSSPPGQKHDGASMKGGAQQCRDLKRDGHPPATIRGNRICGTAM